MIGLLMLAAAAQPHGFTQVPPEAYLDPGDQQIARTGVGVPGRPVPCGREERHTGVTLKVVVGAPTEQCFKMLPAQRFRGLWRNDFEGSQFCPAPAVKCEYAMPGEAIWLSERPNRWPDGKLYLVDFVGRKTMYKGAYGHMGAFDHEI